MLSEHGSRLNNASRIEHIDSSVYIPGNSTQWRRKEFESGGGGGLSPPYPRPPPVPTPMTVLLYIRRPCRFVLYHFTLLQMTNIS